MGYGLDELADGLIVVCDVGLGSRDPDFGGLGVVVTETNQLDRRYASLSELFIEVGLPLVNTRFWPAVLAIGAKDLAESGQSKVQPMKS